MPIKSNGKIVYDSWKDGSDIYKDKEGYYVYQWSAKTKDIYKKYLEKNDNDFQISKRISKFHCKMIFF